MAGLAAGVDDRPADVWEPLITVADLAGGDWPQLAREACTALVKGARDDAQTTGTRLLADLRAAFGDDDGLWTETILGALHKLDESPWGDWYGHPLTARDLAKLLRPYGIKPCQVRKGDANRRGYSRGAFEDDWKRYLPPARVSATTATSATPLASHAADVAAVADTPDDTPPPLWGDDEYPDDADAPDDPREPNPDDPYPF